jgi:L-methionine (R)-S-oxide reductase
MSDAADLQAWLDAFLHDHGGVAGTVHVRPPDGDLELAASVNIPPVVQNIVRRIPIGKGMAGLAWERNEPVSTCNIKDDSSGKVRPGAKAVDAGAGVALPVHDGQGRVRAVVGIAYRDERTLTESELAALSQAAARVP